MGRVALSILVGALILCVAGCHKTSDQAASSGKDTHENPKNDSSREDTPAVSLKIGDPAPPLTVTTWLEGDAVETFQPGRVYVIEFWATWCGAPIRYMPHLAELQGRYKDQGVTVISFTSRDIRGGAGNTEDRVAAFVKRRGPALGYTFAYADDNTTADAWLKAAGQEHFATFVVDKTGRIAYIGGPMYLGMVLPKVLAEGASAKSVGDEMAKVDADYRAVIATFNHDPDAFLQGFADFEARYPPLADFLPMVYGKLDLLLKQGNAGEGKEYAKALVAKAIEQKNVFVLEAACARLRGEKESKDLLALAVRAAEALVRIEGGTDAHTLLNLADAYSLSGDDAKAKEYARKAIEAAADEDAALREEIEKEARRLGAEK
jgi:thiol-disulfide isomerase/thioredoxin